MKHLDRARGSLNASYGKLPGYGMIWVCFASWFCVTSLAADRTTLFVPMIEPAARALPSNSRTADQAFGNVVVEGWSEYLRLWRAHHDNPLDPSIRRFLGLPLRGKSAVRQRPGRAAPRWLGWPPGSYRELTTSHFVIYSRADSSAGMRVAEDLERCYWVWTQLFFPLWQHRDQVNATFAAISDDHSVSDWLAKRSGRLSLGRKLRVVLLRDAGEYEQTVAIPGVQRSTGYYSDDRKTTFLFACDPDDPATRRHELVHQLFREATDSGLHQRMPAEQRDFWLIEGIAGYFESLHFADGYATIGGWDSPRLQFARFRLFIAGDQMSMAELRRDGRLSAQSRDDLARWYAHAIAQTHHWMDGNTTSRRHWIYQRLAELYEIDFQLPSQAPTDESEIREFLSIDDQHIDDNPTVRALQHLCLAGCRVTSEGLAKIPTSDHMRRLTLTGKSIDNESVLRLVPTPTELRQLSLEGTGVDSSIANWMRMASRLVEIDLSSTSIDDSVVSALSGANELTTLWLTGTPVTDQSIETIGGLPKLASVDLQRTKVSGAGLAKLRRQRSNLKINPLVVQERTE